MKLLRIYLIFPILLAGFAAYSLLFYYEWLAYLLVTINLIVFYLVNNLKSKNKITTYYQKIMPLFVMVVLSVGLWEQVSSISQYLVYIFPLAIFNEYVFIQTDAAFVQAKVKKKVNYFGLLNPNKHVILLSCVYIAGTNLSVLSLNLMQVFALIYLALISIDFVYTFTKSAKILW